MKLWFYRKMSTLFEYYVKNLYFYSLFNYLRYCELDRLYGPSQLADEWKQLIGCYPVRQRWSLWASIFVKNS